MSRDRGLYFSRTVGEVSKAVPLWHVRPVPVRAGSRSAAQAAGIRYEAKVLDYLEETCRGFLAHVPFSFVADNASGRIIPDGIIKSSTKPRLCIVEVKLRHDATGYYQLEFYKKIISKAFPTIEIVTLEVTKGYDPSVILPETPHFVTSDIQQWVDNGTETFGVHIWTGK